MSRRFLLAAWGALAGVPVAAAAEPVVTDAAYTHAVRLVDVGHGRRINLDCRGSGSPTVVFDSGLSDSTLAWSRVQPAHSAGHATCSYDRAGLGFSDAAVRPGTPANDVADLHKALEVAGIKPPYVLVGHSSGGRAVRVFADRYRSEVVGMVLVDPTHEDQDRRLRALDAREGRPPHDDGIDTTCVDAAAGGAIPEASPVYTPCVGEPDPRFSQAINDANARVAASLDYQKVVASEQATFATTSAAQTRATRRDFGDMPIAVLSAPSVRMKRYTDAQYEARAAMKRELHTRLAAMSSRGWVEFVSRTGHGIAMDRPEVVIEAIRQVLAAGHDHGDVR